ncbi:MAG TPA: ATP-binding protein [Gemmatimonadaceae bacterium]|nr:ATP-binding protein [Gemmatimonadaceae bacterium]
MRPPRVTSAAAAERAAAPYRAIFVNSTEAIAIVDPDGGYLEQNAAHERLMGYSDEELRGRTPAIHLGEAEFQSITAELRATGICRRECVSRTKDGRRLTIELSSFAVRDVMGEPVCYVGIKRDVTEQRRAAAELRQKFDELQAVYRMAETVARAGALEDIYAAALDELQHALHADRASVLLCDEAGVMRFVAWRGLSEDYRGAVEGHSPWAPDDPDPQPVLVPDALADPSLAPLHPVFAREGIGALAFIPLVDAGRLLGKFMIYFDAPRAIEPPALRLAQAIASHIAVAITRKRSETVLHEREQAHRLLAEAGALLNSSLDSEETLHSITRLVVPAIADWCLVDFTDGQGAIQRIAAMSADPADAALARQLQRFYGPLPDGPHGVSRVARSGRSELMTEVTDALLVALARDEDHLAMLRGMRMASYVCAPLVTRGRTIGVLTLAVGASGRRYTARDLPLAEELARRAAMAVDNARLYHEAQEANRAKSQFLATMSHELRTPLNAIGGYAELLQLGIRGPVTDAQRADLARIQRSQKHLLGLITDLLTFARVEAGRVELHRERVAVEEVLEDVQALVEPQIVAKGLRYRLEGGDPGATCLADREKMQQVLLNLLSNAVKFTSPDGQVTLACETSSDAVHIHVRDTGPGIPPHKLEAIFEPFVQLTNNLTRVTEGTGLGLSISRELARAMGGDVTVCSEPGRGSTFTLTLPAA